MSPLEWLRSRRQPRYATGGYVAGPTSGDAPLVAIDTSCTLTMPTKPSTLPPGVIVTFHPESTPTPELVQDMAEALGVQAPKLPQRVKPSYEHTVALVRQAEADTRAQREADDADRLDCACAVIYSRCHCKTRTR